MAGLELAVLLPRLIDCDSIEFVNGLLDVAGAFWESRNRALFETWFFIVATAAAYLESDMVSGCYIYNKPSLGDVSAS